MSGQKLGSFLQLLWSCVLMRGRANTAKAAGFSLAEVAVVLVVVGMVGGLSMSAGQTILKAGDVTSTKTQLAAIRDALHYFKDKHGRYPCPARENDVVSSTTYGVEAASCAITTITGITRSGNAAIGMVPFKDLGINQSVAMDSWDNKVTYAIDITHTVSSTVGSGSLTVTDAAGNSLTQSPTMGKPIFVLISHGEDGNGAYPLDSATRNACGSTVKDSENCDDDATFVDDKASSSVTAASAYDDYVLWYAQSVDVPVESGILLPKVKDLFVGSATSCTQKTDSTLWCWGESTNGELGDGSYQTKYYTSPVSGAVQWKLVSHSPTLVCAIKSDDTLWCWGKNSYGQIGDGTSVTKAVPTQVSGGGTWKSVNVSSQSLAVCAIKSDDTLWCWGSNGGNLGDGTIVNRSVPTQVSVGGAWKSVSIDRVMCAIRSDDTLWCVGTNGYGEMGDGTQISKYVLTQVNGGGTWKSVKIAPPGNFVCAIKSDDTLWCWGKNWQGELGIGTTSTRVTSPTQVSGGGTWKSVTLMSDSGSSISGACAIKFDDTLWCWGINAAGRLGNGTSVNKSAPTQVSGGGAWKVVSMVNSTTCAIKSDDTLWCWGNNAYGFIGDGTSANKSVPTQVGGGGRWKKLLSSINTVFGTFPRMCAIKSDDTLWCWGNSDWQGAMPYNPEVYDPYSINWMYDGTFNTSLVPTPVTWQR